MKTNKKVLASAGAIGALAVLLSVYYLIPQDAPAPPSSSYAEINSSLKEAMQAHGILVSSPIHFRTEDSISKYCKLFASEEQQRLVQYCTSTEVKDKEGNFLGNIHMVGTAESPQVILVLFQTDPQMTDIATIKTMFGTAIDTVVCQCWEDVMPDGFSSTSEWIDGLMQFHQSDLKPHSKSKQLLLDQKTLQLELSTNQEGYLWHLFIYA